MNVAFLSLGGNMGDRLGYLEKSRRLIEKHCGSIGLSSSIYETDAWGSDSKKKYLNQVVKIHTALKAEQLLKKTLEIEKLGRKRDTAKNSDRTADIDILFFNKEVIGGKNLHIPHPRLHLRKFVLIPFHEIDKDLVHPHLNKSIKQLLKQSKDQLKVTLYEKASKPLYICIEGNIGSGKTTLAKKLALKLNAYYLPEQFEQNHLLPLFYKDQKMYSFPLEYSFLISRFEQMKHCFSGSENTVVSDFSLYKCLWFAKANLAKKEFLLFKKHFDALISQVPKPDLLVFLDTGTANLKRNIKKRARPYEQAIGAKYLNKISSEYSKGIEKLNLPHLVTIRIKTYHPQLENGSIRAIENYLKENFGWHG